MRKTYKIDLDFAKDIRGQRKITIKQQDSVTFYVSIYDDSVPINVEGKDIRLFVRKPDGTILYQKEVLQIQDNVVAFNVNRQGTTSAGLCYAELEIITGEDIVTTRSFVYTVEAKVGSIENAVESMNEAYFLKQIEEFIEQSRLDIAEYKKTLSVIEEKVVVMEESIKEIDEQIKTISSDIETTGERVLGEIEQAKESSISEILNETDECLDVLSNKTNESLGSIEDLKGEIDTLIEEIKEVAQNGLESVKTVKDELSDEVKEAVRCIEELNIVNVEADLNIEELKALIQEARDIAIPSLRQYIETFIPANNLAELNERLEVIYNGLNELDIRFGNYYTKTEVDERIDYKTSHLASTEYVKNVIIETQNESFEKETILEFNNIVEKLS